MTDVGASPEVAEAAAPVTAAPEHGTAPPIRRSVSMRHTRSGAAIASGSAEFGIARYMASIATGPADAVSDRVQPAARPPAARVDQSSPDAEPRVQRAAVLPTPPGVEVAPVVRVQRSTGPMIHRALVDYDTFTTRKGAVTKTKGGFLKIPRSTKDWKKLDTRYRAALAGGRWDDADGVLDEMATKVGTMSAKKYWTSDADRDVFLQDLRDGIADERGTVQAGRDAPETDEAFIARAAGLLTASSDFPEEEAAVLEKLWRTSPDLRPRIRELFDAEGTERHLSSIAYLLEALDDEHRTISNLMSLFGWAHADDDQTVWDSLRMTEITGQKIRYKTGYMGAEERAAHAVEPDAKKLRHPDGSCLSGDSIFVIGHDNIMYAGTKRKPVPGIDTEENVALHHSSFMAGAPVKSAGHLVVNGSGNLTEVNNQSGHYTPGRPQIAYAIAHLDSKGMDVAGITAMVGQTAVDASSMLA